MKAPAAQYVTLVEVMELTRPFEEFADAIEAASRRLETEGVQELVAIHFYGSTESTEAGAILTFSNRDRMIAHIEMISEWEEAGVGFEAALQIFPFERGRAQVFQIEVHLFRYDFDQLRDQAVGPLVPAGDDHDLQYPPIVSEARRTAIPVIREQMIISLPTYVMENSSLL